MIGVITSEKSGSFERMGMKLYIYRTVGYVSSLACSFNQIIWGIKWYSPGLLKLKKLE
jgi:hypothetical protein